MEEIIEILMKRDNNTREEAKLRIDEVKDLMESCSYDTDECEMIMRELLGLEMDYIDYLIF